MTFFKTRDRHERLHFAPIESALFQSKAGAWQKAHPSVDSVIVVDRESILWYSSAVFRVFWHLGGLWKLLGVLSFLPSWLLFPSNACYRRVACRRHSQNK